jgi:colanic acid/amylovoran biosynthesis glycosyltransferase
MFFIMNSTVAHFVRKSTQLRASFIYNQILFHKDFHPVIVFSTISKKDDGGFAEFNIEKYPTLYSGRDRSFIRNILFRYFKQIGRKESGCIIRYLQEQKVKVLHFHYGTDASIFWRVMRDSGLPSVVSFYGYDCSSFPSRFYGLGRRILRQRVFRYASCVTAMSEDMKNDLTAIGCPHKKIIIHYHGIDVKKFPGKKLRENKSPGITILTAGRLDEKKGHSFLLKAIEEIKKEGKSDVKWIIAGDGKQHVALARQINRSIIRENIEMTGSYPYNSEVLSNLFGAADIYIQPSITANDGDKEGIPGTLVEAMAAGMPVISTNHAGIPSIIQSGVNGLLVNEWDVEGMKESILLLSADPSLRSKLGTNAQKYAVEQLDVEDKETELEKIYSGLTGVKF